LIIQCPVNANVKITVLEARYGRYDNDLCPGPNQENWVNCDKDVTGIVQNICGNKKSCIFSVMAARFGEDPCPGTWKYLKMVYKCA